MLVVLDTNVLLSSLLSSEGPPAEIIRRWEAEAFDLATSPPLLEELERALSYPKVRRYFQQPEERIARLLKRLAAAAILVDPPSTLDVISADSSDNRVLECARVADARYIVSGDKHLLDLVEYDAIVVLRPAEFLTLLDLQR